MTAATLSFVAGHAPGMCGIGYTVDNNDVAILSCGADGHICIRNSVDPSKIIKTAQAEGSAGHCLAVTNATKGFAVGDQGHFVKVRLHCHAGASLACVYLVAGFDKLA